MLFCRAFVVPITVLLILTIHSCSSCSLSSWTSTSVLVSWPASWYPHNVIRYEVTCTSIPRCGITNVAANRYATTVIRLTAGTYYRFQVTNVKVNTNTRTRFCTGTTIPSFARATRCFLSNVTTNSVRLSWPNVTGAIRYTYNYGSCDVNVTTATSVNVDGLTTSTNYNFLVTVYGQSGTGNTIACGGSTAPNFARATTCFLSNITTNSVRLTWPKVTGATRYTYNYGSGDVNVTTATSVNVDGLTSSTNYNFFVTVYGQSGTGNTIACGGSTATGDAPTNTVLSHSVPTLTAATTDTAATTACTCTSQDAAIVLGVLFVVFFIGFIVAVVYIIYTKRKLQATGEGVRDNNSQPLSDISNRQPTMTYEPLDVNTLRPVSRQQLPSQTGHQHDYYNVDILSVNNKATPYEQLNINTQRPVVYEQLAAYANAR